MRGLLMDSSPLRQPRPCFPARPALLGATFRAVLGVPLIRPLDAGLANLAVTLRATTFGFGTFAGFPAGLAFFATASSTFLGLAGLAGSARNARSIALATSGIEAMPSTDFRFPCHR